MIFQYTPKGFIYSKAQFDCKQAGMRFEGYVYETLLATVATPQVIGCNCIDTRDCRITKRCPTRYMAGSQDDRTILTRNGGM